MVELARARDDNRGLVGEHYGPVDEVCIGPMSRGSRGALHSPLVAGQEVTCRVECRVAPPELGVVYPEGVAWSETHLRSEGELAGSPSRTAERVGESTVGLEDADLLR